MGAKTMLVSCQGEFKELSVVLLGRRAGVDVGG